MCASSLFLETWLFVDWRKAEDPKFKPAFDRFKTLQDQARAIWAAVAVVAGGFLFKLYQ